MNGATNSTINLYDCTVNLSATNWGTSSASIRVLGCAANTRINAYNSKLSILTGNPTKNSIVAAGAGTITVANCGMYFPAGAAQGAHFVSGGTVRATSCYTIDGAAIVGTPSATSLISDLFITTTLNPKDADPASRPIAPAAGMLCFYTGKLYVCVDATTPAWELVTSA